MSTTAGAPPSSAPEPSTSNSSGTGPAQPSSPWKIATASLIGTSVEWYDFGIYATAAALVFPELFFPEMNRALGTLMSFATLFVGALGRPLGAIAFGHIGDLPHALRAMPLL
ncbi:hypothetical protein ACO0M4_28310 [Streptomyces sp. RGM 3693]|uniref:hypothetical protein n=1 Tax=Streptomyces sp. RGM 3693 TaxID=3413284 RepID=UPI003D27C2A0